MELVHWWLPIVVAVAAAAAALIGWFTVRRQRRGNTAVAHSARVAELPSFRRALAGAQVLTALSALTAGVVLIAATVAASRWVYTHVERNEKFNRDIVLCLDVSGSMTEFDTEVIDRYLEMLPGFEGERMSLVLWNSSAVSVFPLTDDYAFVEEQLTEVRRAMQHAGNESAYQSGTLTRPGASLVGDGLASCVLQFPGAGSEEEPIDDQRSRSVILATDNVINGSPTVSFEQALEFAEANFITVYGLDANPYDDAYAVEYRSLFEQRGFPYYPLTSDESVDQIVDAITSEQTSKIAGSPQVFVTDQPEFWLWLLLGSTPVLLLLLRRLRA